jgi:hypothetical protein
MKLSLCPACHRHVKSTDQDCPFCHAAVHQGARAPLAAAVALGLGLAVAGCSSSSPSTNVMYGPGPSEDASADAKTEKDAGGDVNTAVMYGPAMGDSGHDAKAEKDAGSDVNTGVMYGPAVVDSGHDATFTGVDAAYGPPPGLESGETALGGSPGSCMGA